MARMARHVPARELHLHLQAESGGSDNKNMSTTSGKTNDNVTFPTQKRDLIDASTVKDSLNALPGFKTSAGECNTFCHLPTTTTLPSFLLSCQLLQFRAGTEREGTELAFLLLDVLLVQGTRPLPKSQTSCPTPPESSALAVVTVKQPRQEDLQPRQSHIQTPESCLEVD